MHSILIRVNQSYISFPNSLPILYFLSYKIRVPIVECMAGIPFLIVQLIVQGMVVILLKPLYKHYRGGHERGTSRNHHQTRPCFQLNHVCHPIISIRCCRYENLLMPSKLQGWWDLRNSVLTCDIRWLMELLFMDVFVLSLFYYGDLPVCVF